MRTTAWITFLAAALAAASCDAFVPDIGGLGEPCSYFGDCYGDLICIHGTCSETPGLGEECDDDYNTPDEACADGLCCIGGQCVEAGGVGQPCLPEDWFDCEERCDEGAVCVDGTCVAMGGEGEPCVCPDEYDDCPGECDGEYDGEPECEDGLGCWNGACVDPLPNTVAQPSSTNVWLRCPVGMTWDGWKCTGEAEGMNWGDALGACPAGFQVPSAQDFLSILANCDDYILSLPEWGGGECDSCPDSPSCNSMFTDDKTQPYDTIKEDGYWTRTVAQVIGGHDFSFIIYFGSAGGVATLGTNPNYLTWEELTLCIQI